MPKPQPQPNPAPVVTPAKKKKYNPDLSLKRKMDLLQKLELQGIKRDPRKCIRKLKTGKYCERWAIAGGTVCPKHGGNTPQALKRAKERLAELLDRKIERLDEISEQNLHMPSALGATQIIINRVMGKVGDAPKKEQKGPTVNIGISLTGGTNPLVTSVNVGKSLPPADTDDVIDADIESSDDE